jgi:hypothetical protein
LGLKKVGRGGGQLIKSRKKLDKLPATTAEVCKVPTKYFGFSRKGAPAYFAGPIWFTDELVAKSDKCYFV